MKTSKAMQRIVSQIAQKHGLNLGRSEAHLKLTLKGFMPLVIENVGPNLVSVAHYFQQNGDTIADPDVVFFTGYTEWVPIEISQPLGYQQVAWLNDDGKAIKALKVKSQANLASFCQLWASNIKAQGWLSEALRSPSEGENEL